MHYISTRGHPDRKQFCDILLEGLAPDGGLYVPEAYPRADDATLDRWRGLSYPELAFEILSLYIDAIPPADLKAICEKTYTPEIFGTRKIAPVRQTGNGPQGPLDVTGLITHRIGIDDFRAGFAAMKSGNSGKVVMDW